MASDARIGHGSVRPSSRCGSQRFRSAVMSPRRKRKYVSRNVGDTFSLCRHELRQAPTASPSATRCRDGRWSDWTRLTAQCISNHLMLDQRESRASGKTMATIILLIRAIAQGATGFIIDRAGHFDIPLSSLIPGADVGWRSVPTRTRSTRGTLRTRRNLGAGEDRLSCSRCTRCCSASTIPATDSYGLTDLESEPPRAGHRRGVWALCADGRGTARAAAARGARAPLPQGAQRGLDRDRGDACATWLDAP